MTKDDPQTLVACMTISELLMRGVRMDMSNAVLGGLAQTLFLPGIQVILLMMSQLHSTAIRMLIHLFARNLYDVSGNVAFSIVHLPKPTCCCYCRYGPILNRNFD